jgi:hypothetical protein
LGVHAQVPLRVTKRRPQGEQIWSASPPIPEIQTQVDSQIENIRRLSLDRQLGCDTDEQYRVHLIGGNDDETAIFTLFDEGDHCRLRCEYRDKTIESTATDFFQALCDVRCLLAEDELIPFCYGASLNVYPSRRARDMGRGLKAYKLAVGRHAKIADLVEIFVGGTDVIPTSVALQKKFYRDWLAAPRS